MPRITTANAALVSFIIVFMCFFLSLFFSEICRSKFSKMFRGVSGRDLFHFGDAFRAHSVYSPTNAVICSVVSASSPQPLRSTFWSAKASLVVISQRVVRRFYLLPCSAVGVDRSEERRVGKECRCGRSG